MWNKQVDESKLSQDGSSISFHGIRSSFRPLRKRSLGLFTERRHFRWDAWSDCLKVHSDGMAMYVCFSEQRAVVSNQPTQKRNRID
jgi:hypothetical protein